MLRVLRAPLSQSYRIFLGITLLLMTLVLLNLFLQSGKVHRLQHRLIPVHEALNLASSALSGDVNLQSESLRAIEARLLLLLHGGSFDRNDETVHLNPVKEHLLAQAVRKGILLCQQTTTAPGMKPLLQQLHQLDQMIHDDIMRCYQNSSLHQAFMVLLGLGLIIGLFSYFFQNTVPNFQKILAYTHQITNGSYSRINPFDYSGDLQDLVKSLDRMTATLHADKSKLEEEFAEQTLKNVLLHAAMNFASDGIYITNREGKILFTNPVMQMMTGATEDKLLSSRRSDLDDEPYPDREEMLARGVPWGGEVNIRRVDGSVLPVEESLTPIVNDQGDIHYFVGLIRDISERKRLESEISDYTRDLELMISERTADLVNMNEELQLQTKRALEASTLKSQFLANMSHEIRTPLNAIIGFNQLLNQESPREDQREYIQIIDESSAKLLSLLDNILELSRLDAGTVIADPHPASVRDTMSSLYLRFQDKAAAAGLEFVYDIEESVPEFLLLDTHKFTRIVSNLLDNAIKFTPSGFVRFGIILHNFDELEIYVQDSGIGIPEEKRKSIFYEFQQLDGSVTRTYGGTGLGLAIVRRLTKLLGGAVTVEQSGGAGTIFRVVLPYQPSSEFEQELQALNSNYHISGTHREEGVILADNNLIQSRSIEIHFLREGYTVTPVESGPEVLKQVTSSDVMVLINMALPEMDGFRTCRKLRKSYPNLMIVGITGQQEFGYEGLVVDEQQCLDAGCNVILSSPIRSVDLMNLMVQLHPAGSIT